ncbi:MAG: NADH-quinone oxidoreductase subunit J family protein [Actinomycetes bacterium]
MTVVEVLFGLLGIVALGSAVLVVTTRHLVHAALWLVVTLASIAGCFLLLSAEFVAWVQVLIYIGAVVVLLLFGLMLTRAPIGRSADLDSPLGQRVAAAVTAGGAAAVLVTSVVDAFHGERIDLSDARVAGSTGAVGAAVFRSWVLPFELLSLLLLAALIGAIVLSRRDVSAGVAGGRHRADARVGR